MDFKRIKGKDHYLYDNIDEFNVHYPGIPVRHNWRHGEEEEWIFTDDNYVCQILRKMEMKGGSFSVRTVCGTFSRKRMDRSMLGEEGIPANIYSFSGKDKKDTNYYKRNSKGRELIFARYVAEGNLPEEAYMMAYPDAKNKQYIQRRANELSQTETINKMISKERRKMLEEEGVTDNWLIERYKTIADLAESDTAKLKSLDSLARMSGLFEASETKSEKVTIWSGFTPEQLEGVTKNGQPELIAHAERDKEKQTE